MHLDKLTLLWEDNQFGRKHHFTFDRITASELETCISIMLASSERCCVVVESGPKCTSARRYRNLPFLLMASREQHLSDDLTSKLRSKSLSNWINRSPVLNLQVFRIVQPDARYKETEKRKRLEALALNALIAIVGLLV